MVRPYFSVLQARAPRWVSDVETPPLRDTNGLHPYAMRFFSKVESTFTVPGRGSVIVPAAPRPDIDFRLHALHPIQLRNPGGEVFDTQIVSIEMVKPVDGECRMAFILPKGIEKIWLHNSK